MVQATLHPQMHPKGAGEGAGQSKGESGNHGAEKTWVKARVANAWVVKALSPGGTEWIKAWGSLRPLSHPSVCK